MTATVSDSRSNPNDQIAHAAKVLRRAPQRQAVFRALHRGKRKVKTATELVKETGLPRQRVLQEGIRLVHKLGIGQTKHNGEVAYTRDSFFFANLKQILKLAGNDNALASFPTKYSPKSAPVVKVTVKVQRDAARTSVLTLTKIDSFAKAHNRRVKATSIEIEEARFKRGIQRIIGQGGTFKDWGGEQSDLYSTRLRVRGQRRVAAFAFKGKGLKGVLTPAKMGKNGDQIQRLFQEDAEVYLVQYGDQVAASVTAQMGAWARVRASLMQREIFYGVLDGQDSAALVAAYPAEFRA
jgi:hypothetical protein